MRPDCRWTDDGEGSWITRCGEIFIFVEGTPEENHMRFCCYCGKPIKQKPRKEADQ